jgi:deoxyxylulose-5-phosphate synthase
MKSDFSEGTTATKRLLDGIGSPADIKALREEDLPQLAQEVRDELIKVLSQTGGHLGPNLGVVELTIALHRVFNTPRDRFVMDVSHQGYVHKMFTGRLDRISTMRQYGGLNGFLLRTENEHDCYGAGHAGTALSAGLGMAVGRDLRGGDEHIVVIAGDAESAHEALHCRLKRQRVVDREKCRSNRKLLKCYRHESDLCAFARQGRPIHPGNRRKDGCALCPQSRRER